MYSFIISLSAIHTGSHRGGAIRDIWFPWESNRGLSAVKAHYGITIIVTITNSYHNYLFTC